MTERLTREFADRYATYVETCLADAGKLGDDDEHVICVIGSEANGSSSYMALTGGVWGSGQYRIRGLDHMNKQHFMTAVKAWVAAWDYAL